MTPWGFPEMPAQPGTRPMMADGESGSLTLSSTTIPTALGTNTPTVFDLCRLSLERPQPVVFNLSSKVSGRPNIGQQAADFPAGQYYGGEAGQNTALDMSFAFAQLQYGMGNSRNRVSIDLRNGCYQLPPCTQVQVTVGAYFFSPAGAFGGVVGASFAVSGALYPGLYPGASTPLVTMPFVLTAPDASTVLIPDQARWVEAQCAATAIGAGKPILRLYGDNTYDGGLSLERDYTTGVYTPPYPAIIPSGRSPGNTSVLSFSSTVTTRASLVFGLEL